MMIEYGRYLVYIAGLIAIAGFLLMAVGRWLP